MGRKKEEKTWRFGKIYLLGFPNSEVKNHFTRRYCQCLLQKLSNNGGMDAATEQMKDKQYAEPFKAGMHSSLQPPHVLWQSLFEPLLPYLFYV